MSNPFPGMNPYLEACWGDVHSSLVLYARDVLRPGLPGDLYARVEERVFVETLDEMHGILVPDVRVVELPRRSHRPPQTEGGLAIAEPIIVDMPDPEITETFIEIRDAGTGHKVVTVVEFLSIANKRHGEGRKEYTRKAAALAQGGVSLVEIDLLRSGSPPMPIPEGSIRESELTPYRACVRRGWIPDKAEVYPAPLRARLPVIPVPLRETDVDVPLDLQQLVDLAYENGNYELTTDYRRDPQPPLDPEEARWVDELLRERELR